MKAVANTTQSVDTALFYIFAWSVVLLGLITVLMVYFTIKYSRKKRDTVENIEGNTTLEIVWTVIPLIIVISMFAIGLEGYLKMRKGPKDSLVIEATGVMWAWSFRYPNGALSPQLKLPVNRPVKLEIKSNDVLHSLYIPAFRIKQDAVPGKTNHLYVTPEKVGVYDVFCAEYCGLRHAAMLTQAIVMPQDKFDEWLKSAKPAAMPATASGSDTDSSKSLEKLGESLSLAKGCKSCHSLDGTKLVGPTWKGIYGHEVTVVANGQEKTVKVDDAYLRRSILEPEVELVKGYQNLMPSQKGQITDSEVDAIIAYIKTIK